MILNKISLENFISHKKTQLDLDYGINVVIGPNGAGKTSILDAISFSLFCDYSNRGKKENIINTQSKEGATILFFSEGGIKYSVKWRIKRRGSPKGKLYREQEHKKILLAQGGAKSIIPEIENILSLDKSMFLQSVYVRQGEIEKLVTARPAVRKKLISKLLNIQDLERAYEKIKTIIDYYVKQQLILKTELKQKPELEAEKQDYLSTSERLGKEIGNERRKLKDVEAIIAVLKEEIKILKANKKRFDKLDSKKQVLKIQVINTKEKIKKLESDLEKSLQAETIIEELKTEIKKLAPLEAFSRNLSNKKNVEIKLESLEKELKTHEQVTKVMGELKDEHKQYEEKLDLRDQIIKKRKKIEGSQEVLNKSLQHINKVKKDRDKLESSLKRKLDKYSKILGEQVTAVNIKQLKDKKKKELQNIIEENRRHLDDVKSKKALLKNRDKDLEDNISKLNPLDPNSKTCPTCETELSTDRVIQLGKKFNKEKDQIPNKIKKLNQELKNLDKTRKEYEKIQAKTNSIDSESIIELTSELKETQKLLKNTQKEVKGLEEQAKLLKELDEKLEDVKTRINEIKEPYLKFESAKRQLDKLRPVDQIKKEIKPLTADLKNSDSLLEKAITKLGYEPKKPEKELDILRNKKQKFDQNLPVANLKTKLRTDLSGAEKKLKEQQNLVSQTTNKIENLNYSETKHAKKENTLEQQKRIKNELEKTIEGKKSEKKTADTEAEKRDKKLEILKSKVREKKILDDFVKLLNNIRRAYGKDGIQKMIRARAGPLLERSTRDFFERFNLAYSDIKLDDDYNISVIGPAGEQDIDQISGGERVSLAIALRLAIAQVLSGRVETIIMDEPTTHLDEIRRKELVNILNSFFREGGRIIPQMVIISHHREIEDVADVIYTVNKEDDYSRVKKGCIQ